MVLIKDGRFQRTAQFRGPDLDSAMPAELDAVAGRLNNLFRRPGSGWAIFVEAQRHVASTYPACTFYVSVSALDDAERKADFEDDRLLRLIDAFTPECRWLDHGATFTYLHRCVSAHCNRARVPKPSRDTACQSAADWQVEPRPRSSHLPVLISQGACKL
ncbi:hypothetical protein ATY75_30845 [Rhizobium sp. N122]|nr:hypothetical protein ATY75_30845 [Rhizobium sp. N122]